MFRGRCQGCARCAGRGRDGGWPSFMDGTCTPTSDSRRLLDPQAASDHLDRLYRVALMYCGNRERAEDLVQETYLRVLSRPRFLRNDDDLGYLVRVLRN